MAWDVPNPKGRIASIVSAALWVLLLVLLAFRGDWALYPVLLFALFILLFFLSLVRIYQEWKEGGEWLD